MSTIQLIGIGIATGILIILVIALIVTRRRDGGATPKKAKTSKKPQPQVPPSDLTPETASFLEGAPRDDLHLLRGEKTATPAADTAGAVVAGGAAVTGVAAVATAEADAGDDEARTGGLWTDQSVQPTVTWAAAADLWGSAAATADAEAAATTAAGTQAEPTPVTPPPAEPAVQRVVLEQEPELPMFTPEPAVTEAAEQIEAWEVATPEPVAPEPVAPEAAAVPPVVPFSTEPPPPWEQEMVISAAAETPPETAPLPETATDVWVIGGAADAADRPPEPTAAPESVAPEPVSPEPFAPEPEPWVAEHFEPAVAAPNAGETQQAAAPPLAPQASTAEPAWAEPASARADIAPAEIETPAVEPSVVAPALVEAAARGPATAPPVLEPAAPEPVATEPAAPEPVAAAPRESRPAALSDIISTTNQQTVDLSDPDVRRMLKELAKSEIDLAQQYKQLGQNIDAVLQLTEAQKICQALDMTSHAKLIEQMIQELRA